LQQLVKFSFAATTVEEYINIEEEEEEHLNRVFNDNEIISLVQNSNGKVIEEENNETIEEMCEPVKSVSYNEALNALDVVQSYLQSTSLWSVELFNKLDSIQNLIHENHSKQSKQTSIVIFFKQ
jgi:hypothetical protein